MVVPRNFFTVKYGTITQNGAGIPMATDIAFVEFYLFWNRVPTSLKVFFTALAVIDDLGAILVAIFYTETIAFINLFIAFAIMGGLFILNRRNVHSLFPYLIGGVAMYFMLNSGVHATITGVLLAFVIPFGNGGKKTSSYRLQHFFTNLSPFFILPICNSKHLYSHKFNWYEVKSLQLGIMLGLVIGNHSVSGCFPLLLTLGICTLPKDLKWTIF
jgi:NhaA family Na+:H+ antiporter